MRIGIDIDNTLTSIKNKLDKAAYDYAKKLNKNINDNLKINDIHNNGNIYQQKFNFTYEELKYFLGPIQEEITNNAIPREYCVDVINKLHNEGNEIYIITARDNEFHDNPYLQSEIWLNENNIYYDKLIVNARDKKKACLENNIDLFIDDSISNCINVSKAGIMTITIDNNNEKINGIINFNNWNQIYNFITNNIIYKIIQYNDNYKNEICNFINKSMHKFIGRPYKDRPDISNINDYYINNNGNFWLAIDVKKNKIIGSIALDNRSNEYGILKRFYVEEEHQNKGIGSKLYELFYDYIEKNTKIKKIYLVSDRVLQNAHRFYIHKGYKQIKKIDIDMHMNYEEDDDIFVKDIDRNSTNK